MDAALVIDCVVFAAEFYASYFLYKLYKRNAECLKSLKEAPCFEIDSKLQNKVEKNDGVIKYAAISGSIKALSDPLRSQYNSYFEGVIQEKVTKEHKVTWIRFLGSWTSVRDLQRTINSVPFSLCSNTDGLFRKQTSVEVIKPLTARELILAEIYDIYRYDTVGDAAVGFFHSERTFAIEEIERMLCEDITLTAVGKLIIENNKLKITQPDNGFKYFLTHLPIESLITKVHIYTILSKGGFIAMSTVALIGFIFIARRAFSIIKRKIKDRDEKTKKIKKND